MPAGSSTPEGRTFRVRGHVQGVGFRWWTRSLARRLDLTGSVRNLPDGSVEVRAFGTEAALIQLRLALHQGPAGARVEAVDESDGDGTGPAEFVIAG